MLLDPVLPRWAKRLTIADVVHCAACGDDVGPAAPFAIHRDGFCDGPEVALCRFCGGSEFPACESLWRSIGIRWRAMVGVDSVRRLHAWIARTRRSSVVAARDATPPRPLETDA